MATAKKSFTLTSDSGTTMFVEGQHVPDDIARRYPHFMVGHQEARRCAHNPNLPQKLGEAVAGKLSEDELAQWIRQYHPARMPAGKLDKADLVGLVMQIQG